MKTVHNPKTMIKSKFSNQIHDIFQPEKIKKSNAYKQWERKKRFEKMSDAQKAELFDKIYKLYEECSMELTNYLDEKRKRKQVKRLRESKKQEA
jgi:mevalonate pyrophosphate decarboxylase